MNKLVCALLFAPALAIASPGTPPPQQEISHLISYLEKSGCELKRNRVWQSSSEAGQHLSRKYQYLSGQGMASSAEDFIRTAATVSRVTGQPYMVRCEDGNEQPSALWLGAELQRYRSSH